MKVCIIALTVMAVAAAQRYSSTGGQPGVGPVAAKAVLYSQPEYNYAPMPYSFAYEVKDPQSYNDFGHQEASDGKTVTGSYRVALPDGRLQQVNYKADGYGYVADVQYQGEAKYPEYRPQQYVAPGPVLGSVPIRGPVTLSSQGYAGQGPVRGGYVSANAGAGVQKY